jgi:hypothetical protein
VGDYLNIRRRMLLATSVAKKARARDRLACATTQIVSDPIFERGACFLAMQPGIASYGAARAAIRDRKLR